MVPKGTRVNNYAVPERVDVCQRNLELEAGLSHLHARAVQGDNTVPRCGEDLLEIDHHPLAWLKPGFSRPSPGIGTPIGLAGLVGQDRTLIDAIRIDEIGARTGMMLSNGLSSGRNTIPSQTSTSCRVKPRPVGGRGLLRHRAESIPQGHPSRLPVEGEPLAVADGKCGLRWLDPLPFVRSGQAGLPDRCERPGLPVADVGQTPLLRCECAPNRRHCPLPARASTQ